MAITRLLQTGFEWGSTELASLFLWPVSTIPLITTIFQYTGGRVLVFTSNHEGMYTDPLAAAITQARASHMIRNSGGVGTDEPDMLSFLKTDASTPIVRLRYDHTNTQLEVLCGATEVATYSVNLADSVYRQIGMDVKIDGAAGWVYVYINGVEVIGFDGDTNDGGADFDSFCLGPTLINQNWNNTYVDDVYWDNTVGEGAPAIPPLLRFFIHKPNGDGNYSEWHGSDGNQVNNYLLVDETTPSTADYVENDTTTEKDSYTTIFSSEDVPNLATINAVIPMLYARKDDGATALELRTLIREGGTDDEGDAQALTVDWKIYWERHTTEPGGGAWDKTQVDAMEIGVVVE